MTSEFLKTSSGKNRPVWSKENWGVGVLLLCLIIFFSPLLLFGKSLYYSDFAFITYPIKSFLAQTLQSGALPFWAPSIDSGTPFMAFIPSSPAFAGLFVGLKAVPMKKHELCGLTLSTARG